jgi:hypothetical protein
VSPVEIGCIARRVYERYQENQFHLIQGTTHHWGPGRFHTGNEATTIRDRELHRRRRGPLVVTGRVVGVPDQDTRHTGVHAGRHQESHAVLDFGVVDVRDHGVPDDGDGESEEHDYASEFDAIGQERHDDFGTPVNYDTLSWTEV